MTNSDRDIGIEAVDLRTKSQFIEPSVTCKCAKNESYICVNDLNVLYAAYQLNCNYTMDNRSTSYTYRPIQSSVYLDYSFGLVEAVYVAPRSEALGIAT